jgi:hypothetical protein
VWVYSPIEGTLWQITHKQIYEDLQLKRNKNASVALKSIEYLKRVHRGEEPEEILSDADIGNIDGEPIEILLKSYKWIWGQEDVNYPDGQGRDMSMKTILELESEIRKQK